MDIEFLVHDIYTGTRPQWKLASNFEEASKAFQLVLAQDRKAAGLEEPEVEEQDDERSGPSTEDELADGDAEGDADDTGASDDGEGVDDDGEDDERQSSEESDDEAIIVTRQEEEFDPEWDADFEREYAKMMSDSLESRKLERRPAFDVALPVRSRPRDNVNAANQADGDAEPAAPKMAFSVLTKKGNKQQVRLVNLSDSSGLQVTDPNAGVTDRLPFCGCYEDSATGGARGATAHQESGIELGPS